MKFRMYEEEKRNEPEEELYFKLYETHNTISLMLVNKSGDRLSDGAVLSINPSGLHLHTNLNKNTGLPLDKNGAIKMG